MVGGSWWCKRVTQVFSYQTASLHLTHNIMSEQHVNTIGSDAALPPCDKLLTSVLCSNLAPNRNSKIPRSKNHGCNVCHVSKCLCWQFDIDTPFNWCHWWLSTKCVKATINEHRSLFSSSSDLLLWLDISSVHSNKVGSFHLITEFKLHPYDCMI